jgi:hypothetical protein
MLAGLFARRATGRVPDCLTLVASAARIFGWDTKQPQTQINQLCITQEQLQEIRALREQADAQGDE